jgi:cAMP-dependent protein kinase regulator
MGDNSTEALTTYLEGIGMKDLIKEMTLELTDKRPDEPVGHLLKYLHEKYPAEAKGAKVTGLIQSSSLSAMMNADVDSEESEPDDTDAPEYVPPKTISKKGRKTAVSAESMDPTKMKEQMKNLVVIEKTPEVRDELLKVVANSTMLKMLDEEQKNSIVNAFAGPLEKVAGDNVIVQGDVGETFYLLQEGSVDVYINKDGGELKVHSYKPGDSFGELAIMYNAPRAATCRASSDCKLWSLDRVSFKVIVVAAAMLKRELYQGFLEKVPLLSSCNPMEIQTLSDSLSEETYDDGAAVCTEGDEGNYFYIIKEGTAVCFKGGVEVAKLTDSGTYFGEIALMTNKPRQATVKAQGSLKVLALERATFTRVLGSMEDILKRNMEKYNSYVQDNI